MAEPASQGSLDAYTGPPPKADQPGQVVRDLQHVEDRLRSALAVLPSIIADVQSVRERAERVIGDG